MLRKHNSHNTQFFLALLNVTSVSLLSHSNVAFADNIDLDIGYGKTTIYGGGYSNSQSAATFVIARLSRVVSGQWGIGVEYRTDIKNKFRGFGLGATYDFTSFFNTAGLQNDEVAVEEGYTIERSSYWKLRAFALLGRWSYSGVVPLKNSTTGAKFAALNADLYGTSLGAIAAKRLSSAWDVHVTLNWTSAFADNFGAQNICGAVGVGFQTN